MPINDPDKIAAYSFSFILVCDLSPMQRTKILHDRTIVLIEGNGEMVEADSRHVKQDNITEWVRSQDKTMTSLWAVAEAQFKTWKLVQAITMVFWLLCWLPVATTVLI